MIWNFILYLLYGLAFFHAGSSNPLTRYPTQRARNCQNHLVTRCFGIVHGFHEWLDLLEQLNPDIKTPTFSLIRLIVVNISFLFLFYFGLFLNIITHYGDQALKTIHTIVKMLVGISVLSLIVVTASLDLGSGTDI